MDPLNPFSLLGRPAGGGPSLLGGGSFESFLKPRPDPVAPPVDPAEQQSTLSSLAEHSLGGLAYLGKIADKTFGGRAVRGVLGGHPQELLSLLPGSDTLGLTNEDDAVTGRQLLQQQGLVGQGTPGEFDSGDLAGMAAEMALDPSTYLGFGTLTRAGTLAKKTGTLFKGTPGRIGGFAARESDLAALAAQHGLPDAASALAHAGLPQTSPVLSRALEGAARSAGETINPAHVFDAATGRLVPTPGGATPLAGALGVGLPFSERTPLLTGSTGQWLTRNLNAGVTAPLRIADRATENLTGFSPVRATKALFDPDVMGRYTQGGQDIASTFTRPAEQAAQAQALGRYAEALQQFAPLIEGKAPEAVRAAQRLAIRTSEGVGTTPALLAELAGHGYQPHEISAIAGIGQNIGDLMRQTAAPQIDRGVPLPLLQDTAKYALRQKEILPRQPGESLIGYLARRDRQYAATSASQLAREDIFRNVPGGTDQLNEWARNPDLSGKNAALNPLQAAAHISTELAAGGAVTPEQFAQGTKLADWLRALPDAHAVQKAPYFSEDIANNLKTSLLRGAKATTAADTALTAVGRYAKPIVSGDEGLLPVPAFLERFGLTGTDVGNVRLAEQAAAKRLGVQNLNDLGNYGVPADVARDLQGLHAPWKNPDEVAPVLSAWDALSSIFKANVTAPFPSFHVRNVASGLFNSWLHDGISPATALGTGKEAYSFVRGHGLSAPLPGMAASTAADATKELEKELITHGVIGTHGTSAADVVGQAGEAIMRRPELPRPTGNNLLQDFGNTLYDAVPKTLGQASPFNVPGGLGGDATRSSLVEAGHKVGGAAEQFNRVNNYIGLRQQGYTPAAAAEQVRLAQLDYSNLTGFEKNVMKRVMPWYSFSRRTLPALAEKVTTDPGKLTAAVRATEGGRTPGEFIPDYIAEGAALPIGGAPDGSQRYISSFGLPTEDEGVRALGNLAHGDLTRVGQGLLGMSQPLLKSPAEFIFGKQLFSGRNLTDLRPSPVATLGGLVNEDTGRKVTQVIANTPASRVMTTADKFMDDRKGALPTLFNVLSGVHVSDVDAEKQQAIAQKKLLAEVLTGQPGVRKSEDVYLSRKAIEEGRVSEEQLKLYRMYLDADKRIKEGRTK